MSRTICVPTINPNDDRVEIVAWHVRAGDRVEKDQDLADIETSKSTVTVQAEDAGYVTPLIETRTVVRVGDPFYLLSPSAADATGAAAQPTPVTAPDSVSLPPERPLGPPARFSQEAERLLAERGLSKGLFAGQGLVTARSIAGASRRATGVAASSATVARVLAPSVPGPEVRRTASVSLGKLAEIASLTSGERGNVNSRLTVQFDSTAIRGRLKKDNQFDGNVQPLILFEVARLLRSYPLFTAYFRDDTIHFYDRVDLGLAFDLGKGLKVVTLRNADTLMPAQFFQQTLDIGLRYLGNELRPEELTGCTFTVTDLSGLDVLHFHPLINGEQGAILGIGGDSTLPGHPMTLTLTFDHRLSNGRDAAGFLRDLRQRVLSYAPPASEVGPVPSATVAGLVPPSMGQTIACDQCGVDLRTYYRDYPQEAHMLPYFREDGSLGAACHRCWAGWV